MALHATPQVGDELILEDGTKTCVHSFKLSKAINKKIDAWKEKKGYSSATSTANYDGFYVNLQIKSDELFVTGIRVDVHAEEKGYFDAEVPLSSIFGENGPIAAEWFTGELRECVGESLIFGHTQVISDPRIYDFKKGRLVGMKEKMGSELRK